MFVLLLSVLTVAAATCAERTSYAGYKVIELVPATADHIKTLQKWTLEQRFLDFWDYPVTVNKPVKVMVTPERLLDTQQGLTFLGVEYHITDIDIQRDLDLFWEQLDSRPEIHAVNLSTWNPLSEILPWLDQVAAACAANNAATCQTYTGYYSYEGRPIKALKMSKPGANRQAFYIDATIHAREWITTATLMNIINHMVFDYNTDEDVRRLVDNYDWYFLPVVNPDGYEYTWTTDRLWRKNRSPNPGSECLGTDLNRNFDYKWGTDGVNFDPCSSTYPGASGLSEPETQAVAAEGRRVASSLRAYVSLHCVGRMWMHPWGTLVNHTGSPPDDCEIADDDADMMIISEAAAEAVEATHNTVWERGNCCQVIYPTSGTTMDYMKGVAGIKYSFTLELRGDSHVQPDTDIQPSYEEVWNGVVAMVDKLAEVAP